jgi:hypothetical protein
MYKDAAIEEIRERRRQLFKNKYHNSVSELVASGKKFEQKHPERFAKIPLVKFDLKIAAGSK